MCMPPNCTICGTSARRGKALLTAGCESRPAMKGRSLAVLHTTGNGPFKMPNSAFPSLRLVAAKAFMEVTKRTEPLLQKGRPWQSGDHASPRVNAQQALEQAVRKPTLLKQGECRRHVGKGATRAPTRSAGAMAPAFTQDERRGNTGSPVGGVHAPTGTSRGACRVSWVADGPVLPMNPGNAGGGNPSPCGRFIPFRQPSSPQAARLPVSAPQRERYGRCLAIQPRRPASRSSPHPGWLRCPRFPRLPSCPVRFRPP